MLLADEMLRPCSPLVIGCPLLLADAVIAIVEAAKNVEIRLFVDVRRGG